MKGQIVCYDPRCTEAPFKYIYILMNLSILSER